jgi:hypothetical protein
MELITLAKVFCALVRLAASQAGVDAADTDPDDYCDSNLVMAAAFTAVMGRPPVLPSEVEADPHLAQQEDSDLALWNGAYGMSRYCLYQL